MARKPLSPEARAALNKPVREIQRVDGSVELRPSEQEMHERRMFVRQLHGLGMSSREIVERATQPSTGPNGEVVPPRFRCKPEAITRIIAEIREELAREMEVFAPTARAAGLARLYDHVLRINSDLAMLRSAAKKDWSAIRGHVSEARALENQIAKMEGTLEPVKVEHSGVVGVNLQRALSSMTAEQHEEAVREEEERMKLAAGSITTTSEEPPTEAPAHGRRRPALPAPGLSSVLAGPGQAPVPENRVRVEPKRERSSDIAARREVLSPMDQDVGGRPGPGGIGARVVT